MRSIDKGHQNNEFTFMTVYIGDEYLGDCARHVFRPRVHLVPKLSTVDAHHNLIGN